MAIRKVPAREKGDKKTHAHIHKQRKNRNTRTHSEQKDEDILQDILQEDILQ